MSVDESWLKTLNPDDDLRGSLVFGGRPWKVEVERVTRIELAYRAWEASVLPLNYTRPGAVLHGAAKCCCHRTSSQNLRRQFASSGAENFVA